MSLLSIPGVWRIRRASRALHAITQRFPPLVRCNICAWSGRHFDSDVWHSRTICPGCGLQVRHRLMVAALQHPGPLSADALLRGKRVLHFAPEPALSAWCRALAAEYRTADLTGEQVDLRLDIAAMPEIADAEVDVVIACDVLEHVPDDRAALRELRRVLTPDGCAILAVPQQDDLRQTYEDAAIISPAERERAFGQHDHLRIYGDDFATRVAAERFAVTTVSAEEFPRALVERHVLRPPQPSRHPLATNRRRIYFAQSQA